MHRAMATRPSTRGRMQPSTHRPSPSREKTDVRPSTDRLTALFPLAATLFAAYPAAAQQQDSHPVTGSQPEPLTPPAAPVDTPPGILPIPDYTGDIWTRSTITGD